MGSKPSNRLVTRPKSDQLRLASLRVAYVAAQGCCHSPRVALLEAGFAVVDKRRERLGVEHPDVAGLGLSRMRISRLRRSRLLVKT